MGFGWRIKLLCEPFKRCLPKIHSDNLEGKPSEQLPTNKNSSSNIQFDLINGTSKISFPIGTATQFTKFSYMSEGTVDEIRLPADGSFNLFCDDLISSIHECVMPSLSARICATFTESKSVHIHANYYVMTDDCWRFRPFRILLSHSCTYPIFRPPASHSASLLGENCFYILLLLLKTKSGATILFRFSSVERSYPSW